LQNRDVYIKEIVGWRRRACGAARPEGPSRPTAGRHRARVRQEGKTYLKLVKKNRGVKKSILAKREKSSIYKNIIKDKKEKKNDFLNRRNKLAKRRERLMGGSVAVPSSL
jgi:hypothetical protein